MRRLVTLALTLINVLALLLSCEKAPFLTMSGPRSYTFTDQGGSQSFTFTCNRDWKVSSSDSWIRVSPSSGTASEEAVTVTITCDANTTYDPRKTTLTVKVEELMETIEVSQETNLGIIVSPKSYELSSQAQAVEVEVKANVGYKISIDTACKDWISETSTKALVSTKHVFNIAANTTYDNREGKIYVRQDGSDVAETITIKQSQVEAIILNETSYTVDHEGGVLKIPVKTNVDIAVSIPSAAQSWVKHIETKALSDKEVALEIASYDGEEDRSAEITFSGGQASATITVLQQATVSNDPIPFIDSYAKKVCVEKFDTNGDGEVSYKEASVVTTLGYDKFFGTYQKLVSSFDEFQYFTAIKSLNSSLFAGAEKMVSITLPPYLESLGYSTFQDCSSLKKLVIPDGVKEIDSRVFFNCQGLEEISFAEDIKSIGSYAFYCCYSLKEVNIPATVKDIGEYAFYACKAIKEITIPEGIKELKSDVLAGMSSVETVYLPNSLEIIGEYAFNSSAFSHIHIPDNVVLIEMGAFQNCYNLTSIDFPKSDVSIGLQAFNNCSSLRELTIPPSVISLGDGVFIYSGLETITIPETVKEIGKDQFYGCLNLKSIKGHYSSDDERCLIVDGILLGFAQKGLTSYTTPAGITKIRTAMFAYASSYTHNDELEELTISEGVEDIEYGIVSECTKLRTINLPSSLKSISLGVLRYYYTLNCKAIEPPTASEGTFRNASYCTINVPMESVDKYKAATGWSYVSGRINGYNF